MATKKERAKRRAQRLRKATLLQKREEELDALEPDEEEVEEELLEDGDEVTQESEESEEDDILADVSEESDFDGHPAEKKERVHKDMGDMPESPMMEMMGPTSWDEADAEEAAQEQAMAVSNVTYKAGDLVRNILRNPMMQPEDKASAIKSVGDGYGERLKSAMQPAEAMKKALDIDPEYQEVVALIEKDKRSLTAREKIAGWIEKAKLTYSAEQALSDSDFALVTTRGGKKVRKYPIHDKAHVRNALARAAQMMARGGQAAADARAAMPKIRAAAKKMGIGEMNKSANAVVVEKDSTGKYRAIMWPSNNFIDTDHDIISESAHKEYVDWVNKNMDLVPVHLSWHTAGTQRQNSIDFVGYENGFLIMSEPLEDAEAAALFKAQAKTDLGMSHGTFVLERDAKDPRVVTKYRMVEVSDLPLENAANPFTDFQMIAKEADMDAKVYLATILGPEKAEAFMNKTGMKQKALREAGVEEKAKSGPPEDQTKKEKPISNEAIVEQVLKAVDLDGLNEFLTTAQEALEKVPVLEALVKDLAEGHDERLAKMISAPAEKKFIWQKERASSSDKNLLDKEKDKELDKKPGVPDDYWLSEATQTTPLPQ